MLLPRFPLTPSPPTPETMTPIKTYQKALSEFLTCVTSNLTTRQRLGEELTRPCCVNADQTRVQWCVDNYKTVTVDEPKRRVRLEDGSWVFFGDLSGPAVQFIEWLKAREAAQ